MLNAQRIQVACLNSMSQNLNWLLQFSWSYIISAFKYEPFTSPFQSYLLQEYRGVVNFAACSEKVQISDWTQVRKEIVSLRRKHSHDDTSSASHTSSSQRTVPVYYFQLKLISHLTSCTKLSCREVSGTNNNRNKHRKDEHMLNNYYMARLCAIPLYALFCLILSTVLCGRGTLISPLLQMSK